MPLSRLSEVYQWSNPLMPGASFEVSSTKNMTS
jgi:hypothetical protein